MEDLLVVVVDELIFEDSLALMSPQGNQEQFRSDLVLQVGHILDDSILWLLGHWANTLEDSGQFSDIEDVMELKWGWKDSPLNLFPQSDCWVNQQILHVDNFRSVLLWIEEYFQDLTIDVLNRSLRGWGHVDGEELSLESMRNIISTTTRVIHGSKILELLNCSEVSSVILGQEIESLSIHELSGDFKCDLVTPIIDEWHTHIIQEHSHLLGTRWLESSGLLSLYFWFNCFLEVVGSCCTGEVDSLKQHLILVKFGSVHKNHWGLCSTCTSNKQGRYLTWLFSLLWLDGWEISNLSDQELSSGTINSGDEQLRECKSLWCLPLVSLPLFPLLRSWVNVIIIDSFLVNWHLLSRYRGQRSIPWL